jgi:hypothetical protein
LSAAISSRQLPGGMAGTASVRFCVNVLPAARVWKAQVLVSTWVGARPDRSTRRISSPKKPAMASLPALRTV